MEAQASRFKNQNYSFPKEYQEEYDKLVVDGDWQLRENSMPVWYKDRFLKISEFQRHLSGALVEVIFNIKHFLVAPNQKLKKAGSNTFSGHLEQVTILDLGISDVASPFSQRQRNGPIRIQQQTPMKTDEAPKEQQSNQAPPAHPLQPDGTSEDAITITQTEGAGPQEPTSNNMGPMSVDEFIEGSSNNEKRKADCDIQDDGVNNTEEELSISVAGVEGEGARHAKKRRRV